MSECCLCRRLQRPTGGLSTYVPQPQPSTEHCPSTTACIYAFCLTACATPTSSFPHFRPITSASSPPWTFRRQPYLLPHREDHQNVVTATSHSANCIHTHLSLFLKWKAASLLLWYNPLLHCTDSPSWIFLSLSSFLSTFNMHPFAHSHNLPAGYSQCLHISWMCYPHSLLPFLTFHSL